MRSLFAAAQPERWADRGITLIWIGRLIHGIVIAAILFRPWGCANMQALLSIPRFRKTSLLTLNTKGQ